MAIARGLIDSRLAHSTDNRSDMLASFTCHGLGRDELFSEAVFQILAGSDATATALRSVMLYLITQPPVYVKLQAEVDGAVTSRATPTTPEIIPDQSARKLPYLQAIIREGLYVHPPVTDVVPKRVPKGGDTVIVEVKSVLSPGGTDIIYCAWGVHHDKDIFGEDADHFRLERWITAEDGNDEDRINAMGRTTELIFGYGKYQCLGLPVAWIEFSNVIFEVSKLHRFPLHPLWLSRSL
jgi:cytochrome P450